MCTSKKILYGHVNANKTDRETSTAVLREVAQFWESARIQIKAQQNAIKNFESLYDEYKGLKCHKDRTKNAVRYIKTSFVRTLMTYL